ncbi:MAG: PBP1A family penicillin-binding protein [Candidatus Limnocylindrales bacterium]
MAALLIAILALPLVGGLVAFAYFSRDLPSAEDIGKAPLPQSTKIYDRDGKELLYQFEEERRDLVKYEELPQVLIDATIAAEDHSFFSNPGVDVAGIARAVFSDLTRRGTGQGGASTITQQLVKLRLIGSESSVVRKIKEAILAVEVTRTYSKQQILELYFNQIYYGNGAYGVKAAAATYFGVSDLKQLTLAQAALLAGLPQSPSVLDPSKVENVERAKARRSYVLDQMQSIDKITAAQQAAADAEPIKTVGARVATIKAPHFVFQVRNQLADILGGDEGAVTRGGFKVTTSLDWRIQQTAERQVKDNVERLHGSNVFNAALVSLDTTKGEVLAYVGSVDYNARTDPKVQGQFDVAGIGVRQPGSSFKMFNYLTALKKGATAATVVVDARTDFGGYRPENADLQYHGPVTMRQAVRESRNIPAIKFLQQYSGIEDTIQTARDMGITTEIDPSKVGLSLTLGAKEVKLLDMASSYGTLANLGIRTAPTFILKVEDSRGKIIWEHKDFEQKRAVDANTAYVMVDILKDTTQPDRDFIFGNFTNIGRPAGLKTGTTDNLKDVYAVGFTPTLVTGVWMGNSNGEVMQGISSALGPGILWREYMKEILNGFPVSDWQRPPNIVEANVVVAPGAFGGNGSGLLPSSLTPFSSKEIFVKGTEPRKVDDWYTAGCPTADGAQKVAMELKEVGPASWKPDRDRWIREAMAGAHTYGRYTWNLRLDGACPSFSPSPSPSASATTSPTPPRPSVTLPPFTTPTVPPITLPPGPTPSPRPTPVPTKTP